MSARSLVKNLVAVITALMMWQAGFAAPTPAAADDPGSGTLEVCGDGLVCDGGANPGPGSGPIIVTGAKDRVVQGLYPNQNDFVSPVTAWGFIEQEAKAYVAALHKVPNDSRITDWARGEMRTYMISRLMSIAQMTEDQRSPQEETAYETLKALVQRAKIGAAQDAVDMYNAWVNNKCGFQWPHSITNNVNEYVNRSSTQTACTPLGGLATDPPPPGTDEFSAAGDAEEFSDVLKNGSLDGVQQDMATAVAFSTGLAAAVVAGAVTAAIIAAVPAALSLFATTLAIFPFAVAASTIAGAGVAAGAAAAVPALSGAATLTVGLGIGTGIGIAIFGLIMIAIRIWQVVDELNIPVALNAALSDAQNTPPDLAALTQTDEGVSLLESVFLRETLDPVDGDYASERTAGTPAHTALDPYFTNVAHSGGIGFVSDPDSDTITPSDWDGNAQTVYDTNGWLSLRSGSGTPTYALTFKFENWLGQQKVAGIDGDQFIVSDPNNPDSSTITPTLEYLDASNVQRTATLHRIDPPTVAPTITGNHTEGQTLTFNANAVDPEGLPVTVNWRFEDPSYSNGLTFIGPDGESNLQHCYTDPFPQTNTVTDFFFLCPWPSQDGQQAQFNYSDNGQFHVRVTATAQDGLTTSDVFEVNIGNAIPEIHPTNWTPPTIGEGDQVTLQGNLTDPGADPLGVTIDWGDGTVDHDYFPCDWTASISIVGGHDVFPPFFCYPENHESGVGRVKPATNPQPFSLSHTYANAPASGDTYPIKLTAFDDDGGMSVFNTQVTVNQDAAPTLGLACGLTSDPGLGGGPIGCQTRYGQAPLSVPVNGYFDDSDGSPWTLDVDWHDGSTDEFTYPCPSGDPCPFQTNSNMIEAGAQAGRTFFGLSHLYSAAGSYAIDVSVTDAKSKSDTASASAEISAGAPADTEDPTISVTTPADGGTYTLNQVVSADYSCDDNVAVVTCLGSVTDGSAIDTSSLGQHSFTVLASDNSLNSNSKTVHYTVQDSSAATDTTDPTVTLTTPADGATYTLGQVVKADFVCTDETAIQTCVGTVAKNTNINTASLGAHSFTVTATDTSANTASATDHYTVVYPFSWESPLLAAPTVNDLTAGAKTRLWFSLGGKHGRITRMHTRVRQVNCDTLAPMTRYANGKGVSKVAYNQGTHMYYIVWKPKAGWAGTCREFELRLKDGTNQDLYFHLT